MNRARTYYTITCTVCGSKIKAKGNAYFVREEHAKAAFTTHALAKHAAIATEKVVVKRLVTYEVAKA